MPVNVRSHGAYQPSPQIRNTQASTQSLATDMTRIAIIEDDVHTSRLLRQWVERARPGVIVDQWYDREDAIAAVSRETYDLIVLDIELGAERNAGVAVIIAAERARPVPVLVVSGMPADIYRGVMKAADAWDYLQKPVDEHVFIETLLDVLRATTNKASLPTPNSSDPLQLDLLRPPIKWKGKSLTLPLTAQRILSVLYARRLEPNPTVPFSDFYEVVKSGTTKENIRKQISTIKSAIRDVDPEFDCIVAEPMKGYRWISR